MRLERLAGYALERVRSGESGAGVWRCTLRGRRTLYLKRGAGRLAGQILDEAARLRWLNGQVASARVAGFGGDGRSAWLLTGALPGVSAQEWLAAHPGRGVETVRAIGEFLRRLHALPVEGCPFVADHRVRMREARSHLEAGRVDVADFDAERRGWTAEAVWEELNRLREGGFGRVVTHGDFTLDNVFIQRGRVSGLIDAGRVGVADRYQDLALLWNNLAEYGGEIQRAFLKAYGVRRVDRRRLAFHLCLDEMF